MWYEKLALVLAAIGALNWGLAELGWNLVEAIFSWAGAVVVSIIYYIVALAGLYVLVMAFKK
ncbi:MAG: DUF378 domain-containing protein [Candidatus Pacearchaeota archaeon]